MTLFITQQFVIINKGFQIHITLNRIIAQGAVIFDLLKDFIPSFFRHNSIAQINYLTALPCQANP